ncbi:dipeptide/oligopeptide/nickel ABC transporter permease/ATP-binding protein [Ruania alba]|uniref:Peptide/nickel transport system permease protein n=1 Tax=Ruania alba TaxID=648782 RepID=A0A1H5N6J1_9MICO|nr:dipeptide/oligopeptide/nickel ABC transporter permease/ATP-binding protein [Ruania alba]SEE97080.1 peptide/nickel transport system permease protein [Ruania alba]
MTAENLASAVPSPRARLLTRTLRNPLGLISLAVLVLIGLVAIVAPWLAPWPPQTVRLDLTNAPPFGPEYVLGGDQAGRDILSRLIVGARGAAVAALVMTSVSAAIGVPAGLVAGYYGKLWDALASWLFYILMALPGIILLIVLYTVVGTSPVVAMAAFGVMSSPSFFRLVRGLVVSIRNELYVDAARVAGLPTHRIIGRHVLAAVRAPVIIMAAFLAGAAIGIQAGLEFLGLGDPTVPSWGGMLVEAFNNIYVAPVQVVWPGLAIGLTVGALVLLANAMRDALEATDTVPSTRVRSQQVREAKRVLGVDHPPGRADGEPDSRDEMPDGAAPPLSVTDLQIAYPTDSGFSVVVDSVSLAVQRGEVLGLVGESGSGKTQTAFGILGLLPREAIISRGQVRVDGRECLTATEQQMAVYRGRKLAYVPQEPMSNLDPSFKVGQQLVYGIRAQSHCTRRAAKELALTMLERVEIPDPAKTFHSYPHQISGGMAQRVLIAGAVACGPEILIADEPTTALDVTVQSEILDLLRDLQTERGMSMIIVTHNFGVVADICDRVAVMREGRVVETGEVREVFAHPQHEYTQMLLDAILDDTEPRAATANGMSS